MTKAAQIREMLAKGMSGIDIAKKLKITKQAVYNVAWQDKQKQAKVVNKRGRPAKNAAPAVAPKEPASESFAIQQYKARIEDLEKERRNFVAELRDTDQLSAELVQANLFLLQLLQKKHAAAV